MRYLTLVPIEMTSQQANETASALQVDILSNLEHSKHKRDDLYMQNTVFSSEAAFLDLCYS